VVSPRSRLCGLACALILLTGARAQAFQAPAASRPNLDLQRELSTKLFAEVLGRSSLAAGERLYLRIEQVPEGWIAEQAFLQAARGAGFAVTLADSTAPVTVDLRAPSTSVRYSDAFDDDVLGERRAVRTVSASFSCIVSASPRHDVRYSGAMSESLSDTVRVDEISSLESAGVKSTQGVPPSDSFIDRIVEPFVIVGATGVAVYLLFNIRS
jgi:hypothetical protein